MTSAKKDLQSFQRHDSEYNSENINSVELNRKMLRRYAEEGLFEKLGFDLAIRLTKRLPQTHVDIGSGTGWLVDRMSDIFERSVGIEPSKTAIGIAQKIIHKKNIDFINSDMIDGMRELSPEAPVFITTSTVLNHIENFYVQEFLALVDTMPTGSVLFFDERYDKNINWNMWHVRSKDWWSQNLPNWQLVFLNIENSGYSSGIYGTRIGKESVLKTHAMGPCAKAAWHLSYATNIINRLAQKITRPLRK